MRPGATESRESREEKQSSSKRRAALKDFTSAAVGAFGGRGGANKECDGAVIIMSQSLGSNCQDTGTAKTEQATRAAGGPRAHRNDAN